MKRSPRTARRFARVPAWGLNHGVTEKMLDTGCWLCLYGSPTNLRANIKLRYCGSKLPHSIKSHFAAADGAADALVLLTSHVQV